MDVVAPAWVLTTLDAPAEDLRRVKQHLSRGGAMLMFDGQDYVRVVHNGPTQPSTTSTGLLLTVSIAPEMSHAAGVKIKSSGLVFLPRRLNASSAAKYACMPRYLLVDPQLNWLTMIPPEDVERTQAAIVTSSPEPARAAVVGADIPAVSLQTRNSLLVMGSSFVTASYYLARDHLGMKSALFLLGIGMLSATEYSETPVFSQGSEWVLNVTSEVRSEFTEKINATWQSTKFFLYVVAGSVWLVGLSVIWSYRKKSGSIQASAPPIPVTNVISTPATMVQPTTTDSKPTPKANNRGRTDSTTCLSGATSGVDSGVEDSPDVAVLAEQCEANKLLIDSNPRSCLAFTPCLSNDVRKCKLMLADGVVASGNPVTGALDDVAL